MSKKNFETKNRFLEMSGRNHVLFQAFAERCHLLLTDACESLCQPLLRQQYCLRLRL